MLRYSTDGGGRYKQSIPAARPPDGHNQTRVPEFGGHQTRKPGFAFHTFDAKLMLSVVHMTFLAFRSALAAVL